jgi:threonine/homoserine/homoserine lactone efflux protein
LLKRIVRKASLVLKLSQRQDGAMQAFMSFLAVAVVAAVIPGPDSFVVLRTALTDGPRAGTWAAAGSAVGNVMWGSASALGVAAVLAASATAFSAIKLAGAAYLVVIGVQALRARHAARASPPLPTSAATSPPPPPSAVAWPAIYST